MDAPALQPLDEALNQQILALDNIGAFEQFYAEGIVMQENAEPPCVGKDANRARQKAFAEKVARVHAVRLLGSAVSTGVSFSEWKLDLTFADGRRESRHEVSVRRWQDGKVVNERFYHSKMADGA